MPSEILALVLSEGISLRLLNPIEGDGERCPAEATEEHQLFRPVGFCLLQRQYCQEVAHWHERCRLELLLSNFLDHHDNSEA